ncbi:SDR family NAD(P)-dependent oxidoreductase [Aquisalimonas sp.]|uniref:SDR family NAD(P)-dependent oxidoreductase n=1 Tax=Aquisalimonas sp. TaxID=1872621 RepID=UPI0025BD5A5A|nr:SDR family NAD(P)-dependent oxidoreductase [Aquisalimonas sp.]
MTHDDSPRWATIPRDYTPPADLLAERIVLVTGAASGLGRALAQTCAGHGATVVLLDKDLRQLEAVYDAIEQAGHPQPALYPLNLEGVGPAEYLELASSLDREFGRLDVLVHNAAMLGVLSPMQHYDAELWARVLHVNINAPFLLNKTLLGLLQRSERGRILFISDRAGRRGRAFWGAYGVSKFAQEGMMETLAAELGSRHAVRTMSVDPGIVNTALRRQCYPGEDSQALPQPNEVAPALLYPLGAAGNTLHGARLSLQAEGSHDEHDTEHD